MQVAGYPREFLVDISGVEDSVGHFVCDGKVKTIHCMVTLSVILIDNAHGY